MNPLVIVATDRFCSQPIYPLNALKGLSDLVFLLLGLAASTLRTRCVPWSSKMNLTTGGKDQYLIWPPPGLPKIYTSRVKKIVLVYRNSIVPFLPRSRNHSWYQQSQSPRVVFKTMSVVAKYLKLLLVVNHEWLWRPLVKGVFKVGICIGLVETWGKERNHKVTVFQCFLTQLVYIRGRPF